MPFVPIIIRMRIWLISQINEKIKQFLPYTSHGDSIFTRIILLKYHKSIHFYITIHFFGNKGTTNIWLTQHFIQLFYQSNHTSFPKQKHKSLIYCNLCFHNNIKSFPFCEQSFFTLFYFLSFLHHINYIFSTTFTLFSLCSLPWMLFRLPTPLSLSHPVLSANLPSTFSSQKKHFFSLFLPNYLYMSKKSSTFARYLREDARSILCTTQNKHRINNKNNIKTWIWTTELLQSSDWVM